MSAPKRPESTRKIVRWNIITLVVYSVVLFFVIPFDDPYRSLSIMAGQAVAIAVHAGLALITGLIFLFGPKKKDLAQGFFLSVGWVLLIGFSSCLIGAGLGDAI